MIARIVIPLLLVIVLSDLYIDVHYFRRRYSLPWWLRLLWWVPCIALSTYTITLASLPSFAPSDLAWLNTYLLLLGLFVGPKAIFALCSFLGSCLMRLTGWPRINLGHYIGILLGCGGVLAYIYGLTVGVRQVKVNHLTLQFEDLPAAFDVMPRMRDWRWLTWHRLSLTIHEPIYPTTQGPENVKTTMDEAYKRVMSGLVKEYQGFVENPDQ